MPVFRQQITSSAPSARMWQLQEKLRAVQKEIKAEQQRLAAAEELDKKRKEHQHSKHMGWHPDYNPHDLQQLKFHMEDTPNSVPVAVLISKAAKRVISAAAAKISQCDPPMHIETRRDLIAKTYEQIIAVAARPTLWQRFQLWAADSFQR